MINNATRAYAYQFMIFSCSLFAHNSHCLLSFFSILSANLLELALLSSLLELLKECVKRRALKSVRNNPYCSDAAAKDAIEAVWDICYNDTHPFDRAP